MPHDLKVVLLTLLGAGLAVALSYLLKKLFPLLKRVNTPFSPTDFSASYTSDNYVAGGQRSPATYASFSRGQDLMNGMGKSNPELIRKFFEIPNVIIGEYIPADPSHSPDNSYGVQNDDPRSERDFGNHPPGHNPFKPRF